MDEKDKNKRSGASGRTVNFFALRIAVAAYLVYLGFDLFRSWLVGASTLSPTMAWLCGPGFMAAGVVFGIYSFLRYRRESAAAKEKNDAPNGEEKPDGE